MGKFYWNQRTSESVQKSVRYFEDVIASDPHDARGYAGVACAYAIESDYGFGPFSKRAALARAFAFAKRALAVDPKSAEAHAAFGLAQVDAMQMKGAESEFRRAIALDPNYAPAHQWYGMSLLRQGRGPEAFAELQKATDLDPESVAATDWLSEAAYLSRRYNDAVNFARQTLDLSPQRTGAYVTLGLAYEALGDSRHAIAAYDRYASSCRVCRVEAAPLLAHAYAASHRYIEAEVQLRIAQAGMAAKSVDPEDIVTALVAMGRRNEALEMLRDEKYNSAVLAIDPRMDPVRDDKRFRQFVQAPA
jgi:tetratricopeptide (TPR) repeat protein